MTAEHKGQLIPTSPDVASGAGREHGRISPSLHVDWDAHITTVTFGERINIGQMRRKPTAEAILNELVTHHGTVVPVDEITARTRLGRPSIGRSVPSLLNDLNIHGELQGDYRVLRIQYDTARRPVGYYIPDYVTVTTSGEFQSRLTTPEPKQRHEPTVAAEQEPAATTEPYRPPRPHAQIDVFPIFPLTGAIPIDHEMRVPQPAHRPEPKPESEPEPKEPFNPLSREDLSIIALGLVTQPGLMQRYKDSPLLRNHVPSSEVLHEIINQTDFPEDVTVATLIKLKITTALDNAQAFVNSAERKATMLRIQKGEPLKPLLRLLINLNRLNAAYKGNTINGIGLTKHYFIDHGALEQ